MEKSLQILISLLCFSSLYAQNDVNEQSKVLLSNEGFFTQAELVIEGQLLRMVYTYNLKGTVDYVDGYTIDALKVLRVYKGDQSLVGDTIYVVKQGGLIGQERSFDGEITISYIAHNLLLENGVKSPVSFFTPSIFFLTSSDHPDDLSSKYASMNKYKYLKRYAGSGNVPFNMMFVCNEEDKIIGLNNLVFHSREDFYDYMRRFKGFTVTGPSHQTKNQKDELNDVENDSKYLKMRERNKTIMDSLEKELFKEKGVKVKKKVVEKPKNCNNSYSLNLTITNKQKILEGGNTM